jgi:hypothetical protein
MCPTCSQRCASAPAQQACPGSPSQSAHPLSGRSATLPAHGHASCCAPRYCNSRLPAPDHYALHSHSRTPPKMPSMYLTHAPPTRLPGGGQPQLCNRPSLPRPPTLRHSGSRAVHATDKPTRVHSGLAFHPKIAPTHKPEEPTRASARRRPTLQSAGVKGAALQPKLCVSKQPRSLRHGAPRAPAAGESPAWATGLRQGAAPGSGPPALDLVGAVGGPDAQRAAAEQRPEQLLVVHVRHREGRVRRVGKGHKREAARLLRALVPDDLRRAAPRAGSGRG